MDTDIVMVGAEGTTEQQLQSIDNVREPRNFVISVDFGTTCSSVAYVGLNSDSQRARIGLQQVEVIEKFPDSPLKTYLYEDVPTEILYQTNASRQTEIQETPWDNDDSDEDDPKDSDGFDKNASTSSAPPPLETFELSAAPPPSHSISWGFGVHERLRNGELDKNTCKHLRRFKLMLDDSDVTKSVRDAVAVQCRALKDLNLIKEDLDVIADYLDQLFRCVKRELVRIEGYEGHEPVEFVLCVPAVWKSSALRSMQLAMTKAIQNSGLGRWKGGAIDNLFLVSEPEAAAACMLASGKASFKLNEIFMVLDAGGGTVDAVTYKVERKDPLRLTEAVESRGELCGSSFINERFQKLLERRLKNEKYLEENGETLDAIIDSLVVDFERQSKKRIDDMQPGSQEVFKVKIPGLRENQKRGFEAGRLILTPREIDKLFTPSLQGVAKLMNEQLDTASEYHFEKIILTGGFAQSERLERYLRESLARRFGRTIELVMYKTQWSTAAVARGGVLRALRKEDGPIRHLQSSFGFLRTERYGDETEHAGQIYEKDKIDGHDYVYNTIDWVLRKGETVPAEYVINRQVENTFAHNRKKLICREILYVSDEWHPSHYHFKHPVNKGAQVAGRIEVDLTYLKSKTKLIPRPGGLPYRKICFTLRIIVNGRTLRYEVIPQGEDSAKDSKQLLIAAAFRPGTE